MSSQTLSYSNLIGKTFNRLTVIDIQYYEKYKCNCAICMCECGNQTIVVPAHLKAGKVKSCGCYKKERFINRKNKGLPLEKNPNFLDGRSRHPLYKTWNSMKQRCYNKNDKAYKHYGQRGIKMCNEWLDFWGFVKWVDDNGGKPEHLTLDRIDVNGNYEPSNCRWVSMKVQCTNKTDNVYLTFNNKTQTISEWASELNINYRTLNNRINRGWSVERTLTEKVHTHHPKT